MGSRRGCLGGPRWHALPGSGDAGRHVSVRGLYSAEETHFDRLSAHCEMEKRAVFCDCPKLSQRWQRLPSRSSPRSRADRNQAAVQGNYGGIGAGNVPTRWPCNKTSSAAVYKDPARAGSDRSGTCSARPRPSFGRASECGTHKSAHNRGQQFAEPYNSSRRYRSTPVSTCRRAPTPRKESYAVQRILSLFLAQTRSYWRARTSHTHGGYYEPIESSSRRRPHRPPNQPALVRRYLSRRRNLKPRFRVRHS